MLRQRVAPILLLTVSLILASSLHSEQLKMNVAADAAILINAETGAILYEKNARQQHFPASITKIATALYTLNKKGDSLDEVLTAEQDCIASIQPDQKIRANYKLPSHWVEVGSNHMGIKLGEQLSIHELLYGLMLISANDGANVLAKNVSGSISAFMVELNSYLQELGCKDTHFTNAHGLHHPEHKTTAYDMALITKEALKNPTFREIVSTVRHTRPKTNKQEPTTMVQSNRLLRSGKYYYPKAIGVKTGGTLKAANTFVAAAKHEGRTLIAVLLHSVERGDTQKDSISLFEAAFNEPKVERILLKAGPQNYQLRLEGTDKPIETYLKENLSVTYYPAEEPKMKAMIYWDQLTLPVQKDQRVGELRLTTTDDQNLKVVPVYAQGEVVSQSKFSSLSAIPLWVYWAGITLIGILFILVLMRTRK